MPVRNAGPQHPARLLQRFEDYRGVAAPPQVIGAGQAGRPGADDRHGGAVRFGQVSGDRVLGQGQSVVAEEPLHAADADRLVVFAAVARGLARVVADPPGDRGQWVVLEDRAVSVEEALVLDEVQVLLDLLAGRAGVVTRRRLVPVDRAVEPEVAGGEQPLAFLFRRRGSHSRDRELQMRWNPGAAYGHVNSSAWAGAVRSGPQSAVSGQRA